MRECVIAIQGGGVYGLSLLGQAKAVLEVNRYEPLGFAGTSAGALIATLLWGGLSPSQIEGQILALARCAGLATLLGPFEGGVDPGRLDELTRHLGKVKDALRDKNLCSIASRGRRIWSGVRPALDNMGMFSAAVLEDWIENCLRLAPKLPESLRLKQSPLTFGDYHALVREQFRPPLVLTATNLTFGRLELIKSFDPACKHVSVAKAACASAAFPLAIRPRTMPELYPDGGTFVDGGVVANFPLWVFSEAMRDELASVPEYDWMAYRPWIRIGLRVVDHAQTQQVDDTWRLAGSLFGMLTGGARNQLEDLMTQNLPRRTIVAQPSTTTTRDPAPPKVLDLMSMNVARTKDMISLAKEWAEQSLRDQGPPSTLQKHALALPAVTQELKNLIASCALAFGGAAPQRFSANVFLIDMYGGFQQAFSEPVPNWSVLFHSTRSGFAGLSFTHRRTYLCNREIARELGNTNPQLYRSIFHLPPVPAEVGQYHGPRPTWLLSTPVFDPEEARVARLASSVAAGEHESYEAAPWSPPATGPVIGVLNLDAYWVYNETSVDRNPNKQWDDPRIRLLIDLAEAAALRLAHHLSWKPPQAARLGPRDEP
jgi:predicted acylesterase/phospholipase RssA